MTTEDKKISRRSFLDYLMGLGFLATAAGAIGVAGSYLWPPKEKTSVGETLEVGPESQIPPNEAKLVSFQNKPTLVINSGTQIIALSAVCTHLGCVVKWEKDRKRVFCPCHAGVFDINGNVLEGPPPAPLPKLPVRVVNGMIHLG